MTRNFLTAVLITTLGTTASAQTGERLSEISTFFNGADIRNGPEIVDCILSEGAQSECFQITVAADPQAYTPGPWCPTHISDDAEASGIWFLDGETVDVTGDFITKLAEIYGDSNWQLYDSDTGNIRYTGTLEECEAAARPDVDPAYQNYCVQCLPETLPQEAVVTYVIPIDPVTATRPARTNMNGSGVAYNGVRLDGPAPVDAILGAYTIAPFDDCGGHVNPFVGYHYHAVTDCLDNAPATGTSTEHGSQIGIAMDGYPMLPHLMADGSVPTELDQCNGHVGTEGDYHYHVGDAGSNAILGCLTAQTGCTLDSPNGVCDATARLRRP